MFDAVARPRTLPFVVYIGFIAIADLLARLGAGMAELRWLYGIKILAVLVVLLWFRRDYVELARQPGRWSVPAVALALGCGVLVFVLWISLSADWMMIGSSAGFDPRSQGALIWSLVAVRIAGAALVVPVMEELFWRSFLMRWIGTKHFLLASPTQVGRAAFVITVILFGLEHNLWLAGMIAGAVYGWLYVRTGVLWLSIVAHGVTNGMLGIWIISTGNWTYW